MNKNVLCSIATELSNWPRRSLQEPPFHIEVLGRILVSLHGGEAAVPYFEGVDSYWREVDLLAWWLSKLNDATDVQQATHALINGEYPKEEEPDSVYECLKELRDLTAILPATHEWAGLTFEEEYKLKRVLAQADVILEAAKDESK